MPHQDAISLVCDMHGEIGERAATVTAMMEASRQEDFWKGAEGIIDLLRTTIVEHFRREEIMIKIIERDERLGPGQVDYYAELRAEHVLMLESFADIESLGVAYNNQDAGKIQELVAKTGELAALLYAHADKEDKDLFPFARQVMNDKQLAELRAGIEKQ